MHKTVEKIFFALLRFEIAGVELCDDVKNLITEEVLFPLYKLSKKHDLAHLIGDALDKNGLLVEDSTAKRTFLKERNLAIFRYEKTQYEYESIIQTLSRSGREFIPLKGSVIRQYYPEPWMRTSCDIDILVKESDLDELAKLLCDTLSYSCESNRTVNELSLYSPSGVHLELHYDLTEGDKYGKEILSQIWDYSVKKEENTASQLTDSVFYFYHIVHMLKHFESGGCGVRPFIDLWLLNKNVNYSISQREEMLKKDNILQFANNCEKLANAWFGEKNIDELGERLQSYILSGGVFGTLENRVGVQQAKKGGKFKYLISRIFISKCELQLKYPKLKKHPYLLPYYHVKRWLKPLFKKDSRHDALTELSQTNSLHNVEISSKQKLLSDLGLKI